MSNGNGKDCGEDTGEFDPCDQDKAETAPVDWLDRELAIFLLELTQLKALTEESRQRVRGATRDERGIILAGFIAAGGASAAFIYNRMNAFNDAINPRPL